MISIFTEWSKKHGKVYASIEAEAKAKQTFFRNDALIRRHNAMNTTFDLGHNKFSDMSLEEFSKVYLAKKRSPIINSVYATPEENILLPYAKNWLKEGVIGDVKDQGRCGSCWAFSAVASVEAAYAIRYNSSIVLSEEQLVDCDVVDNGCDGGLMANAFRWIEQNPLCTSTEYPYVSGSILSPTCNTSCRPKVSLVSYERVEPLNEWALKYRVYKQPVSVAVDAMSTAFQFYKSGVVDTDTCGTQLDHGVAIIGYGNGFGKDYWIVRNSWGEGWGDEGYIKIARGKNMCGIEEEATYPVDVKIVA